MNVESSIVPLDGFVFIGYLNQVNQPSLILRLYGRKFSNTHYEYYSSHEVHPFLKLPIKQPVTCPLIDQQTVKVSSYRYPFKVNLN